MAIWKPQKWWHWTLVAIPSALCCEWFINHSGNLDPLSAALLGALSAGLPAMVICVLVGLFQRRGVHRKGDLP